MALPPSTANWHWKNKNVTSWGKAWFERELTTLVITGEGIEEVKISSVFDVEGDVELGQRKSKLITIYDCKLIVDWEGTTSEGDSVKGRIHIPEVSHEITLDGLSEYVFNWEVTSTPRSSPSIDALLKVAKVKMNDALRVKFSQFPVDLIETHGKDLTVSAAPSADPSRSGTPAPPPAATSSTAAVSAEKPPIKAPPKEAKLMNTTTVTAEASFMASADDLFELLTDEKKIPSWTRAGAVSQAKPDTQFSLFSGGVKGKYISLDKPKEIVQTWALVSPTWPAGHEGTLTTTISQQADSTKVTFSLKGVPTGMEDEIKRNLEGYYIHGFKSIGYVPFILAPSSSQFDSDDEDSRGGTRSNSVQDGAERSNTMTTTFIVITIITLLFAIFAQPFLSRASPSSSRAGKSRSKPKP